MTKLTAEQIAFYETNGYLAPVKVLSSGQATALRAKLEHAEADHPELGPLLRNKAHLLFTWLDDLIRNADVLDAVESILGPNILCWGSSFFIKEPRNPAFVSWHQDSTYWGLDPADIVTAWVALSESSAANGALRVIPGTHRKEQLAHRDTFADNNLLSRGQEIAVEVDEAQAAMLELHPGEMSLHHVKLVHGSDPNPSDHRRVGFAIRYLPTHVRQTAGITDAATLVRGVDTYHHFIAERAPDADLSPDAVALHAALTNSSKKILMRGANQM